MRYLKKFNESNISDDIKDICLELEDIGFNIEIKGTAFPTLEIYKLGDFGYEKINYTDIKESVERVIDFLGKNLIDVKLLIFNDLWKEYRWHKCELEHLKLLEIINDIKGIRISYYNNITE